jgi:chromosome segregation ATPase
MTAEEIAQRKKDLEAMPSELDRALNSLREKRNNLLAKTDWTSSSDLTMSDAMKTYRQQLRDATEGLDTVEKVQAYEFPKEVLN